MFAHQRWEREDLRSVQPEEQRVAGRGYRGSKGSYRAQFHLSSLVLPRSTCHFLDVVCPEGNLNSCEVSTDERRSFQYISQSN